MLLNRPVIPSAARNPPRRFVGESFPYFYALCGECGSHLAQPVLREDFLGIPLRFGNSISVSG